MAIRILNESLGVDSFSEWKPIYFEQMALAMNTSKKVNVEGYTVQLFISKKSASSNHYSIIYGSVYQDEVVKKFKTADDVINWITDKADEDSNLSLKKDNLSKLRSIGSAIEPLSELGSLNDMCREIIESAGDYSEDTISRTIKYILKSDERMHKAFTNSEFVKRVADTYQSGKSRISR